MAEELRIGDRVRYLGARIVGTIEGYDYGLPEIGRRYVVRWDGEIGASGAYVAEALAHVAQYEDPIIGHELKAALKRHEQTGAIQAPQATLENFSGRGFEDPEAREGVAALVETVEGLRQKIDDNSLRHWAVVNEHATRILGVESSAQDHRSRIARLESQVFSLSREAANVDSISEINEALDELEQRVNEIAGALANDKLGRVDRRLDELEADSANDHEWQEQHSDLIQKAFRMIGEGSRPESSVNWVESWVESEMEVRRLRDALERIAHHPSCSSGAKVAMRNIALEALGEKP